MTATLFPLEEPSGGVCVGVTDETRMHGALSAISERLVALEERMLLLRRRMQLCGDTYRAEGRMFSEA